MLNFAYFNPKKFISVLVKMYKYTKLLCKLHENYYLCANDFFFSHLYQTTSPPLHLQQSVVGVFKLSKNRSGC